MATPQIGSQTFLSLKGPLDEPGIALRTFVREGVDGVAYRRIGLRSDPTVLRTVTQVADAATAQTTYRIYKQMEGADPVTITDETGTEWENVQVLSVRLVRIQPIGTSTGSGDYLVVCEWTVQSNYTES